MMQDETAGYRVEVRGQRVRGGSMQNDTSVIPSERSESRDPRREGDALTSLGTSTRQGDASTSLGMTPSAAASGTFQLGGNLPIHRLGFGAMRITGDGVFGPPKNRQECLAVLRRAIDLGVNFIDTAESYGPGVSEELIAAALHPYPDGVVIATKGGFDRPGPGKWVENGRPERLREELDGSLLRLELDRIDLWQLHRIDPKVPEDDQFETIREFQREGKIRHAGLSEVTV